MLSLLPQGPIRCWRNLRDDAFCDLVETLHTSPVGNSFSAAVTTTLRLYADAASSPTTSLRTKQSLAVAGQYVCLIECRHGHTRHCPSKLIRALCRETNIRLTQPYWAVPIVIKDQDSAHRLRKCFKTGSKFGNHLKVVSSDFFISTGHLEYMKKLQRYLCSAQLDTVRSKANLKGISLLGETSLRSLTLGTKWPVTVNLSFFQALRVVKTLKELSIGVGRHSDSQMGRQPPTFSLQNLLLNAQKGHGDAFLQIVLRQSKGSLRSLTLQGVILKDTIQETLRHHGASLEVLRLLGDKLLTNPEVVELNLKRFCPRLEEVGLQVAPSLHVTESLPTTIKHLAFRVDLTTAPLLTDYLRVLGKLQYISILGGPGNLARDLLYLTIDTGFATAEPQNKTWLGDHWIKFLEIQSKLDLRGGRVVWFDTGDSAADEMTLWDTFIPSGPSLLKLGRK